jgi:arylsulfatase A-like enzyme
MAGPAVTTHGISDALVELIDLGPTLRELAGLPALPAVHGRSLAPLLRGETSSGRDAVFSEHDRQRLMVREGDWKLVYYPCKPYGELYHLADDPDELRNRYDDPTCAARRHTLEARLLTWLATTRR